MTSFEVVYEQFLSLVSIDFSDLTDSEIKQELFQWTKLASSKFKFPRINLDFVEYTEEEKGPNGETGPYFINEITQKEITVIIEYMKLQYYEQQLIDSKKYEMYYEDANLKLPRQSALITQINRSHENQAQVARRVEHDYYRTKEDKPTIGNIWTR